MSLLLPVDVEDLLLEGSASIGTGNALDNMLRGNDSGSVLNGGAGNDKLLGGAGDDTYVFASGGGSDVFQEEDFGPGNWHQVRIEGAVSEEQLWWRQVGGDLEVSIIGTEDRFTIADWFWYSDAQPVEAFHAGGKVLAASSVQALVDAMASFDPPAAGETTLSAAYATSLTPTIAAAWQ